MRWSSLLANNADKKDKQKFNLGLKFADSNLSLVSWSWLILEPYHVMQERLELMTNLKSSL